MKENSHQAFGAGALGVITLLLILLAVQYFTPRKQKGGTAGIIQGLVAQSRGRNPFVGQAGNGYYENLMGKGGSVQELTPVEWLIRGKFPRKPAAHSIYRDSDFLGYEGLPNLKDLHPENQNIGDGVFGFTEGPVETNSYGFFDREHSLNKPSGTQRIAILGDSVTRGWGIPMDERYSTLLENDLNEQSQQHIEVMNFAVTAYSMPQIFDVAMEKVPPFHPDVYVLALTQLSGSISWGSRITELVKENRDLKYDIFRDLVKNAGLKRDDTPELSQQKLLAYRVSTLRKLLLLIKENTEQHSAKTVVVLLPGVEDRNIISIRFHALREALQGTGIPVIDITDTFDNVDIDAMRVNWHDVHPNAAGQRMIADNLYKKMRQ